MSDPLSPIDTAEEKDDAMPQGEAYDRAQEELDALPPGPHDQLHFEPEGNVTQTGEDPIRDFLGRSDGP